jgi:hypothetical protein
MTCSLTVTKYLLGFVLFSKERFECSGSNSKCLSEQAKLQLFESEYRAFQTMNPSCWSTIDADSKGEPIRLVPGRGSEQVGMSVGRLSLQSRLRQK